MNETKKTIPEAELNDEELDAVTGGTSDTGSFFCKNCQKTYPLSDQSQDPNYCKDCYHYVIEPEQTQTRFFRIRRNGTD